MLTTVLSFAASPLGRIAGLLFGAATLFGAGFYKGDSYRAALDIEREFAAEAAWQNKQDEAAKAAHDADVQALTAQNADLTAQIATANEALKNVSSTACFTASDTNALRSLWKVPHNAPKAR